MLRTGVSVRARWTCATGTSVYAGMSPGQPRASPPVPLGCGAVRPASPSAERVRRRRVSPVRTPRFHRRHCRRGLPGCLTCSYWGGNGVAVANSGPLVTIWQQVKKLGDDEQPGIIRVRTLPGSSRCVCRSATWCLDGSSTPRRSGHKVADTREEPGLTRESVAQCPVPVAQNRPPPDRGSSVSYSCRRRGS